MGITKIINLSNFILSRSMCSVPKTSIFRNKSVLAVNSLLLERPAYRCSSSYPMESAATNTKDISQSLICFKYLRLIKKAIREFGPIVEENKKLEVLLHGAYKHNLPSDFIDFAIRLAVDTRATMGLMEILLFSNCHFIVQYEDIDQSLTKHHILKLCEKYDAFLNQENVKWPRCFEQKGILSVKNDASCSPFSGIKEAKIASPNVRADSVNEEIDPEGFPYLQFNCEPNKLHEVKRNLTKEGCLIEEAFVGFIPKRKVTLPRPLKNAASQLIMELNKVASVDNVYTNVM